MKKLLVVTFLTINMTLSAATYYVATNGNDNNPGTLSQPFATWQKGCEVARAGDLVYIRGGIYYTSGLLRGGQYHGVYIYSNASGTADNMIRIWAYPGESPVLDCINMTQSSYIRNGIFLADISYWWFKGLTVRNVKDSSIEHSRGITGNNINHCLFEQMTVSGCADGFSLGGFSDYNKYLNCDAFDNSDVKDGGDFCNGWSTSGYGSGGGTHLEIVGCRSWHNSDDGFDFLNADGYSGGGYITVDNCWSFRNGYNNGNGVGFKLGNGYDPTDGGIQRTIHNCLAWENSQLGFDEGQDPSNINSVAYNNTSYNNDIGFFWDYTSSGSSAILRNNVSYANRTSNYFIRTSVTQDHNSWNGGVSVSSGDFLSLDDTGADGPRQSDGSLPNINFLRLAPGSDLIDAGTNVGLPYSGNAPDMGAYETGSAVVLPAPAYVSSVIQNSAPAVIEITFNLGLANFVPPASVFAVNVNGASRAINSVVVSGTKVTLTLSSPVIYGDVVTLAYTRTSVDPLQSVQGIAVESFSGQRVTNNVAQAALPAYVSSVIQGSAPSIIVITFNLSLANIVPAASSFTVSVNSAARTISSVAVSGTKVSLTLSSPVKYGDAVTVAYSKPSSNPLQTPAGGQAASFSAHQVTNSVAQIPVPSFVSAVIQNATPARLEITFSLALAASVPSGSSFTVSVNSAARSITTVAVSGTVVSLTLSSPVAYGNTVTVSYSKPSSNPLQTSSAGQVASFSAQKVTNNVGPVIPAFSSASVENAAPTKLIITYNMDLAATIPSASAFVVTVNSVSRAVTAVSVSGAKVTLTLASPVTNGNTIKVSYTKPSSNPLQTPAGGQAATFSGLSVTNNVSVSNTPPVVVVDYRSEAYSGFVEELNASGSYDANNDNLTFSWVVPGNISVSSKSGPDIEYLSPVTDVKRTVQFVLNVSDGKTVQSKTIPVDILPYEPGLDIAEIVNVEASGFSESNIPANIIDGNIGTLWASEGDNQWLLLTLKGPFSVQHVKLAFQPGQKYESFFDILGSEDMTNWEQILTKSNSCAFSGDLQVFNFPATKATKEFKYIKLIGHGNAVNAWNYLSEFRIFGYRHKNPSSYEEQPVKIYPNPAHDYFNVKIEETSLVHDYLRIVNMTGSILYEEKIDPGVSEFQVPINLLKGIYLVQIGTRTITLFSQKLVVSN